MGKRVLNIDLHGDKEVLAMLNELERNGCREISRKGLRAGAKLTKRKVQQRMPAAGDSTTGLSGLSWMARGKMRRYLKVRASLPGKKKKRKHTRPVQVFMIQGTREQLGIDPDNKYFYPAAVEFGAPKKKRGGPIAMRDYRGRALRTSGNAIMQRIGHGMRQAFPKALAKAKAKARRRKSR